MDPPAAADRGYYKPSPDGTRDKAAILKKRRSPVDDDHTRKQVRRHFVDTTVLADASMISYRRDLAGIVLSRETRKQNLQASSRAACQFWQKREKDAQLFAKLHIHSLSISGG